MESVHQTLVLRAEAHRQTIEQNRSNGSGKSRAIIALAGPPGSGKSTVAEAVANRLNAGLEKPTTLILSTDGFHYPRATLDAMSNAAEAHARRGVHWTFDADGVVALARLLNETSQLSVTKLPTIRAPSFDHKLKDPVIDDVMISPDVTLVILEGLWLLYDETPWNQIQNLVDETWWIDVDKDLARWRVAERHVHSGIETTLEAALRRVDANDSLNGEMVRQKLVSPNVEFLTVGYTNIAALN
ncbi:hypothetical protein NW762_014089 [Fusarium torreyae]|uniref:Phosphoribulokinase/uridine kinase domain-containing protein n=1 Tax=Fusarium torreyae TaxID=1237075 RepID=A0A9W8V9N0_9HYPO|nr:hypothetical protein NW762_014089 [Fusarium torreyae]